jgi:HEPN domain-containing protein
MNRAELKQLARDRMRDAKALLAARRWAGAYYVAGYAVECALKACVVVRLNTSDEFPDRKFSEQCWTHDLLRLLILAGLKDEMDAAGRADPVLGENWEIVKDWTEGSRYLRKKKTRASDLYRAITDKDHGVLPWIARRW